MHTATPASGRAHEWLAFWRSLADDLVADAGHVLTPAIRLAIGQGFVITSGQARQCGVDAAMLRRLVRRRLWQPMGRGVVAVVSASRMMPSDGDHYESERRQHAVRSAAAALVRPGHLVCGRSAAVLTGLPVLRIPAEPVITTCEQRTLGRDGGPLVRSSAMPPRHQAAWFGLPITAPARTVADLARLDRFDGIMAADAMLREALATRDELRAVLARCTGWPGVRTARLIERLADSRAESPLESVVRLLLDQSDIAPPELQWVIVGADGRSYRVDFCWPRERVILEADGRLKYSDDQLWAEKRRELALVRAGYRVERVVWTDVGRGWREVVARLTGHLHSAPPVEMPNLRPKFGVTTGEAG